MSFEHVLPGDVVIRMLAGTIPMRLRVAKVDDTLIYCGDFDESAWTFARSTGAKVDHTLGWGPQYGTPDVVYTKVKSTLSRLPTAQTPPENRCLWVSHRAGPRCGDRTSRASGETDTRAPNIVGDRRIRIGHPAERRGFARRAEWCECDA